MNDLLKLDLGCGSSKQTDFTGVDCLKLPGVDIVHNLNEFPYPFADSTVSEVRLDQVLEHLFEPLQVMEEVYRICCNGAYVMVGVPYFRSYYAVIDPTHRNFFSSQWFNYFDPHHPFYQKYQYTSAQFRVERIEFDREFKAARLGFLHRILIRIAETKTGLYEDRLAHLLPLSSLTYYLTVVK